MHALRPTHAEINLAALRHNFLQARRQAGAGRKVLAVVKADAYGHGAVQVAAALEAIGADFFGVALVEEGRELRQSGIRRPILVLGGIYPGEEEELLRHRLTPLVFDLAVARRLDEAARRAGTVLPCHLKIDTGMGRVGFRPAELPAALAALKGFNSLHLEGVLSHLAVADELAHSFNDEQFSQFRSSLQAVRAAGFSPEHIHLSNSAALFSRELPELTMVRPGITLYGALPSPEFAGRLDLEPVMSLRSVIAQLKEVPAGTGVSYGHRFVADRPTLLATVPIGYADGYSRRLSNRGVALVRGRRVGVAGTVCMDWLMLDVTDVPDVAVGDRVTLLGSDGDQRISAEEWAEKAGTISYEVFCQVSKRVPRCYRAGDELGRSAQEMI